jgi:hypothetical protein
MTAMCVLLGLARGVDVRQRREQRACALLQQVGARVICDDVLLFTSYKVFLEGTQVRDQDLLVLRELSHVSTLSLDRTPISVAGVEIVSSLDSLNALFVDGTSISDDAVDHLAKLKNLRVLSVRSTGISQCGVERLRRCLPNCSIAF